MRVKSLIWLALLLTGCGTLKPSSPPPPAQVQVPSPPAEIMAPEDLSESYSEIVRKLFLLWQNKLTDWRVKS